MNDRASNRTAGLLGGASLLLVGVASLAAVASAQTPATPGTAVTTSTTAKPAAPAPAASPAPTGSPAASPEREAACDRFVAHLSGSKEDKSVLAEPEFRAFALSVPDLVICGAIARDSDELCRRVYAGAEVKSGFAQGPYRRCLETWSNFHELRANPGGRSFMFNEVDWQNCQTLAASRPYCERVRAAMRAGDPSQCSGVGPFEAICRAHINLDKKQCGNATPKREQQTDEFRRRCEGEFGSGKISKDCQAALMVTLAAECKKTIDSRAPLAKGLKALAESGPEPERTFAKAALGQKDACADQGTAAKAICLKEQPKAAPPSGGAPATPAPAQNAPTGSTPPTPGAR